MHLLGDALDDGDGDSPVVRNFDELQQVVAQYLRPGVRFMIPGRKYKIEKSVHCGL